MYQSVELAGRNIEYEGPMQITGWRGIFFNTAARAGPTAPYWNHKGVEINSELAIQGVPDFRKNQ
jgi:hypothetical protein